MPYNTKFATKIKKSVWISALHFLFALRKGSRKNKGSAAVAILLTHTHAHWLLLSVLANSYFSEHVKHIRNGPLEYNWGFRLEMSTAQEPEDEDEEKLGSVREQDRFLPIANISRIMKKSLPANAKIAKDAKETVQECVSEFISFITSE